jgi:uncharacterized membrane protein YhaH (DUF805 family)
MPADDMQLAQTFLIAWYAGVAIAIAVGATYSAFRSASLSREAATRRHWSDFYLVTHGRTTRRGFWLGFVAPFLLLFTLAILWDSPVELPLAVFAVLGASVWPGIAVGAKRFHDRGKSGWFLLIFLIPALGLLWLLIELGFFRGTVGHNRFGPAPLVSD